jgi:hypothetical protein
MLRIGNDLVVAFMSITAVIADTESDKSRGPEPLKQGGWGSESFHNEFFCT